MEEQEVITAESAKILSETECCRGSLILNPLCPQQQHKKFLQCKEEGNRFCCRNSRSLVLLKYC